MNGAVETLELIGAWLAELPAAEPSLWLALAFGLFALGMLWLSSVRRRVAVAAPRAGGADKLEFCGAGALAMENKDQYAVLMRVALLSSMEAAYTTRNLGFRCAQDDRGDAQ